MVVKYPDNALLVSGEKEIFRNPLMTNSLVKHTRKDAVLRVCADHLFGK
jgi:hypothetical protein